MSRFSPEALNLLFIKGLLGWFMQAALLKVTLLSLGSGEAPLLDIIAYAGYTFTGICLAVLGRIILGYSYYFLMPWTCLCMGVFLVKTMKRVLFAEVRSYDSSRHHYLLLFIALVQFPLFTWLGNITINWLLQGDSFYTVLEAILSEIFWLLMLEHCNIWTCYFPLFLSVGKFSRNA